MNSQCILPVVGILALFSRHVLGAFEQCGAVLTGEGDLQSHGFPNGYPPNYDCDWKIEAGPEDQVNLVFSHFSVEESQQCRYDYFQIYAMGQASPKFCGEGLQKISRTGSLSVKGPVQLMLKSDESEQLAGFSMRYKVTPSASAEPPTTATPEGVEGSTARPILSCDDKPCKNGGECITIDEGEIYCFCSDGFDGDFCEINIDECAASPCENGGTCLDEDNGFHCECPDGFIGDTCAVDVDDCQGKPCENGGTCIDGANSFECQCMNGYTGWNCGEDIDECASGPCLNMGVCENMLGYYECVCFPGYTGLNCEIPPSQTEAMVTAIPTQTTSAMIPPSVTAQPTTVPTAVSSIAVSYIPSSLSEFSQTFQPDLNITRTDIGTTTATPLGTTDGKSPDNVTHFNANDARTETDDTEDSSMKSFLISGIVLGVICMLALVAVAIRYKYSPNKTKVKPAENVLNVGCDVNVRKEIQCQSHDIKKVDIMDDPYAGT